MTDLAWLDLSAPKAKAEMKKQLAIAEKKAAKAKKAPKPKPDQVAPKIKTKAALKAFWRQNPKARDLYGHILRHWRASKARRPDVKGFWAAFPYPAWEKWTGLPVPTLKRHLDLLEGNALIERTRGRFGGNAVYAYLRPSALSLSLSDAPQKDWDHLGTHPDDLTKPPKPEPVMAAPKPIDPSELPASDEDIFALMGWKKKPKKPLD
jgi:hypothetical protein